jgi:hypothetical protein
MKKRFGENIFVCTRTERRKREKEKVKEKKWHVTKCNG